MRTSAFHSDWRVGRPGWNAPLKSWTPRVEEGQNIGDPGALRTLATELGLDEADAAITGDLHGDDVARATAEAQSVGINAIPAFLLDDRLIVLGAQPDAVFEQAFDQLARA